MRRNSEYNTNINASTDITCTGSQTCTVRLKANEYNLEVTSNNDSWGTVSPSSGKIIHGNILEINITPASGYKYKDNTCGVAAVNNKLTINVSGNIKCQVIFEKEIKTLYATLTDGKSYKVGDRGSFDSAYSKPIYYCK